MSAIDSAVQFRDKYHKNYIVAVSRIDVYIRFAPDVNWNDEESYARACELMSQRCDDEIIELY